MLEHKFTRIGVSVEGIDDSNYDFYMENAHLLNLIKQAMECYGIQEVDIDGWCSEDYCFDQQLYGDVGGVPPEGKEDAAYEIGADLFCLLNMLFDEALRVCWEQVDSSIYTDYVKNVQWIFDPLRLAVYSVEENYNELEQTVWDGAYTVPSKDDLNWDQYPNAILDGDIYDAGSIRRCGEIAHIAPSWELAERVLEAAVRKGYTELAALLAGKRPLFVCEPAETLEPWTIMQDRAIVESRKRPGFYHVVHDPHFDDMLRRCGIPL